MREHCRVWVSFLVVMNFFLITAHGSPSSWSQTIALSRGWNAVFVQVDAGGVKLDDVLGDVPVDIVASWFGPLGRGQLRESISTSIRDGHHWRVWYAPDREEAMVRNLFRLWGRRAYLVHAKDSCEWTIEGRAGVPEVRWSPNAFTLTGFCVGPDAPPSFEEFFANSAAHRDMIFYRLVNGIWRRVSAPANTSLKSGEAFWVYCKGQSDFQGSVTCSPSGGVSLGETGGDGVIEFANHGSAPIELVLTDITGSQPLRFLRALPGEVEADIHYETVEKGMSFGIVEPDSTLDLQFSPVNREMTAEHETRVLSITAGNGQQFHLPIELMK